jgi:hypothetical protein
LQAVLDASGKTPEKERNQAWNDIQTWSMIGPITGRAENEADLNAFFDRFHQSDLSAKMKYLGEIESLTIYKAGLSGQNTGTAAINWAKALSPEDREFYFTAGATPDKNGRYEIKGFDDYLSLMSRYEKEWKPRPTGGEGPPLSRDEQVAIADLEALNASQRDRLDKLKIEYSNRFGAKPTPADTIELSGPAAKLAANLASAPSSAQIAPNKVTEGLRSSFPDNKLWLQGLVDKMAGSGTSVPEKEAAKAFNEFQSWINAGPMGGRAENEKELNDLALASANTEFAKRLELLTNMESLAAMKATSNGTNPFTARLEFWKGASEVDREILMSNYSVADKFGQRELKNLDQFYKVLENNAAKFDEASPGQPNETALLALKEIQANNANRDLQLQLIQRLEVSKAEYNRRYGGMTDTIELSGPAAKLAAKNSASDGANDVALKALETLKEVAERQREWAKNLAEENADGSTNISDQTKVPAAGEAKSQAPAVSKPGSVVSIAA